MLTVTNKSKQTNNLIKRLNKSATLTLSAEDKRAQRISNLMSIVDDPTSEEERRKAEKFVDENF